MKTLATWLGLMAALLLVMSGASAQSKAIRWYSSYNAAMKESKATGKPIFLEFRCAP